ncbi:xanthine dehydrogenase small subunit [Nocardioides sp. MH1]|uniref:xanthine dehydrogenase small subunit n=1 Tax=Nocardioides sp. MH1 TaxID=3242490 RepID=UPI003520660A
MEHSHAVVNGETRSLSGAEPPLTALDWLRGIGLTGAKEGCAEGECGACSVLVARAGVDAPTEWTAINACLLPAASLAGQEVVTAEGLGDPDSLHPVQREMAVRGGSQCGYCTPGFVCSMAAEYYRAGRCEGSEESGFDLHALSGNLCRCTGYRPIVEAAQALGAPEAGDHLSFRTTAPPPVSAPVRLPGYVRPADLEEALALLAEPGAVALAGSTDLGVESNLKGARPGLLVGVDHLPQLRGLTVGDDVVEIGAGLSLSEVERRLDGAVPLLAEVFPLFASRLIRNGATIGGNLGTASPIGDLAPALLALDASLVLVSAAGEREVPLAGYFTGYRETVREPGELIGRVRVPRPLAPVAAFHKVAKRRFDDISSVAVAFAIDLVDGEVARAAIGLGGVAATPIRATEAEDALVGRPWTAEVVTEAAQLLGRCGTPIDDHRASGAYRRAMLATSLEKLFAEIGGAA